MRGRPQRHLRPSRRVPQRALERHVLAPQVQQLLHVDEAHPSAGVVLRVQLHELLNDGVRNG